MFFLSFLPEYKIYEILNFLTFWTQSKFDKFNIAFI